MDVIVFKDGDNLYLWDLSMTLNKNGNYVWDNKWDGPVRIPDELELLDVGHIRCIKENSSTIFNNHRFNEKLVDIYNTFYRKKNKPEINVGDVVINESLYNDLRDIYEKILSVKIGYRIRVKSCDYEVDFGEKCIKIVKEEELVWHKHKLLSLNIL